jgi:hypothetical protein
MSGFDGDTECMMLDLNATLLVPFDIELDQPDSNRVHHSTGFHSQRVPCVKKHRKRTWQNPKYFEDKRRALATLARRGMINVTAERRLNEGTRPFLTIAIFVTILVVSHHLRHYSERSITSTKSKRLLQFPAPHSLTFPLRLPPRNNPLNIALSSGSSLATILDMILPSHLL